MQRWLITIFIVFIWSCESDMEEGPVPAGIIPAEVEPYVDRFVWEAQKRGLNPDISRLSFEFTVDIDGGTADKPVVGSCTRFNNLDLVKIDTLSGLWLLSGDLGKEEIVFHELGHCLLNRVHKDNRLTSGEYKSIMRTVGLLQYGDLQKFSSLFPSPEGLKVYKRDYYLDELFNEHAAAPCWSDPNTTSPFPLEVFKGDFIKNRDWNHLWVDPENNLWLYGQNKNFKYVDGRFIIALPEIDIDAMSNDQHGKLWIAGSQDQQQVIGIYEQGDLQVKFSFENDPGVFIEQLLIDDLERVWISDSEGNLFANSGGEFEAVPKPAEVRVSIMRHGPDNRVYMLMGGRFYIFEDTQTFVQAGSGNTDLPDSFFRNLEVDAEGTAWLQPNRSPYLLQFFPDFKVKKLELHMVNLAEHQINDLTTDLSGKVWVATSFGIKEWEGQSFSNYCKYNTGLDVLDFNWIRAGNDGSIWSMGKDTVNSEYQLVLSRTRF